MSEYRSAEVQELFSVSHETVRRWAIEYREFLSSGANPDGGKHRVYSDDDLRVLALVATMKNDNHSDDDIYATLKAGQLGDLPSLLDKKTNELSTQLQLSISKQENSNLTSQLEYSMLQAQEWRDKSHKLEGQVEQLQKQVGQLQAGQVSDIRLEAALEEIKKLNREIGRLEGRLEIAKGDE